MAKMEMDWNLEKVGPTFSSIDATSTKKITENLLLVALFYNILLDTHLTLYQERFVYK